MKTTIPASSNRLLSLDVMRGLIMILLAGESCHVWGSLSDLQLGAGADVLINQFFITLGMACVFGI